MKYPTILNLPQTSVNRQLYEMVVKLETKNKEANALITSLEERVSALEEKTQSE